MKKLTFVMAILAAASTAAVAKDFQQEKKTTTSTVAATQMNDAEMDKITAGGAQVLNTGPDASIILPAQGFRAIDANSVGNLHSHNGNAANLLGLVGGP
jgi:hypothetical protein